MFGKKKLKDEIVRLNYRVADLEERLCPCEDHDWKKIDFYTIPSGVGIDVNIVHKCKCRRCGKLKEEIDYE